MTKKRKKDKNLLILKLKYLILGIFIGVYLLAFSLCLILTNIPLITIKNPVYNIPHYHLNGTMIEFPKMTSQIQQEHNPSIQDYDEICYKKEDIERFKNILYNKN